MASYKGIGIFAAMIAGVTLGELIYRQASSYFRNQNIDPNFIKPRNVEVKTVDRNEDGYKEVVLEVCTEDGRRESIDLTPKNLEKFFQEKN